MSKRLLNNKNSPPSPPFDKGGIGGFPGETKVVPRGQDRRIADLGSPDGLERRVATADRRHGNNRQYATFFLEDHFFGVEVEKVQEILTSPQMTRVPLSSPVIAGLINLRGQIVTAIDLRIRLKFPPRPTSAQAMSLVVLTQEGPVNLLVDLIGDVIEVRPDLFEPPPKTLREDLISVVDGVYKLKERLLLALNTDSLSQVPESVV